MYTKPTISELSQQCYADLLASLRSSDPEVRGSVISIFAKVFAGMTNGTYSMLEWNLKQMFPNLADPEWVSMWGTIKRIPPLAASVSDGKIKISGTVGAAIPTGYIVRRSDGVEYVVTGTGTIPVAGFLSTDAEAVLWGSAGNASVGTQVTFISVPAGISSIATVDDMTGGTDAETAEQYAIRVVESFSYPARGGSAYDYKAWAKEATAVTNTWVYGYHPSNNPQNVLLGDVLIMFMMYGTYADGIPAAGDVLDVKTYIDSVRPLGMGTVNVVAPTKQLLNFTLKIVPDTTANREEVTAQLKEYITRTAEPNGTLRYSSMNEAVSRAIDVNYHTMSSPSGDVTPSAVRNIFALGTITWSV